MKEQNRKLCEIAKTLEKFANEYSISSGLKIVDSVNSLYLAVFEDEKNQDVLKLIKELKLESDNSTEIAEAIASEFGVDFEGGPLDDPDHWIWELTAL